MTPIQEAAIPVLLEGKDVIGQAQTGTGKTAAFGIPVLQNVDAQDRSLQAVILCPTRELAIQATEEMHRFAKYMHGVRILAVYGGQEISRQIRALKGGVQVIVGTPGRVMDHMRRHTLKMDQVKMVVLDEADEMLNMGFREDIETILQGIPSEHQTALFSATMPKPILEITHTYQKDAVYLKMIQQELTIDLVKQYFYRVTNEIKVEVTCRLLDYHGIKRSLIFCNTKRQVDELNEILKNRGYAAEGLHGDLSQSQRDTVMNRFRSGNLEILIATDVAARGIDVDDVEAVINYDLPQDIEYYVHRIGRTGRAGREGRSFSLVCNREMFRLREIEKVCHTTVEEQKVPSAADVVSIKAEKALTEAIDVLERNELYDLVERIEDRLLESDWRAVDLAAAFLRIALGEEPVEIPEVKPERRGVRRDNGYIADGRRRRDGFDAAEGKRRRGGFDAAEGKRRRGGDDAAEGRRRRGGDENRRRRSGGRDGAAGEKLPKDLRRDGSSLDFSKYRKNSGKENFRRKG